MNSPSQPLVAELRQLRLAFREVLTAYGNRMEGQISQIIQDLNELAQVRPGEEEKGNGPSKMGRRISKDMEEMLILVRELKLKPEKGRRKDIRRVEDLICHLLMKTDQW